MVSERLISQGSRSDTPTNIHRTLETKLQVNITEIKSETSLTRPHQRTNCKFPGNSGNQLLAFQEHFLPLVLCFNHLYFAGKKKLTCFPDFVQFLLQFVPCIY